jgi:hypothetical protein
MCVQSQPNCFIPAADLWDGFNPLGVKEGIFVIFRGYIDESFDGAQNVFSLSCLIGRGKAWSELERKWKLHLAAKNKQLAKDGRKPISRYHASDCSGCRNEFKGWSRGERDAFVVELFGLLKNFPSHTVVFDVQLDDLCSVFPEWAGHRMEAAYHLLTGFLMFQIASDFKKQSKGEPVKITLFHDLTGGNGKYNAAILRSFTQKINDQTFDERDYFTTIAPLQWQHSIALQPADLVAFECFKEATARLEPRKSRRAYKELIDMKAFGIHSMSFNPQSIRELRRKMEEQQSLGLVGPE